MDGNTKPDSSFCPEGESEELSPSHNVHQCLIVLLMFCLVVGTLTDFVEPMFRDSIFRILPKESEYPEKVDSVPYFHAKDFHSLWIPCGIDFKYLFIFYINLGSSSQNLQNQDFRKFFLRFCTF